MDDRGLLTWEGKDNNTWLEIINKISTQESIQSKFVIFDNETVIEQIQFLLPYLECYDIKVTRNDKFFLGTNLSLNFYFVDPGMSLSYR